MSDDSAPGVERPMPPVTELTALSLVLIVVGGIFIASHLPRHVPLTLPVVLLAVGTASTLTGVVLLARVPEFAWSRFLLVARWALLAYVIEAGMLEYVFVKDGTRGSQLVVLSLSLLVFAVDIPMLIAFTAARYQRPSELQSDGRPAETPV